MQKNGHHAQAVLQRKFVLGAVGVTDQPKIAAHMTVNRAANVLDGKHVQRGGSNHDLPQKKFLLFEKNHKIPFQKKFPILKTDEGRTLAGAVASRINIGDFIAFLKNR
jgi:hypothetical protein